MPPTHPTRSTAVRCVFLCNPSPSFVHFANRCTPAMGQIITHQPLSILSELLKMT